MTKQTIAIIGATGKMGAAIAGSLSRTHNRLLLCAKDATRLEALAQDIRQQHSHAEIDVADCTVNAAWEADIIILAVPYPTEKEIAAEIRDVANQKIVVSISNPLNADYNGLLTASDTSAAEEIQDLLPNSRVIKAFNTTFAADFATPVIAGEKVDAFVAGDNQEAIETVAMLVTAAGFNPIIAGDLTVSRTLERMALLLIQLTINNNYNWLAGWKVLHH